MAFIQLEHYSLSYPIFSGGARSLKKTLFRSVRSKLREVGAVGGEVTTLNNVTVVRALNDISLRIDAGERVGLVGHNGAGKSSFLCAVTGIYESTHGKLTVEGTMHSLLDATAGMNADLTGRENIRLFAARLGYSRKEGSALEAEIEAFAELGPFLDMPVRLYSAGMGIRLGFGLATAPRPDILIMDEWFTAGDQGFRERATQRLTGLIEHADILLLTSHDLGVLEDICTRIIWLEHGVVKRDGPVKDVLAEYRAST